MGNADLHRVVALVYSVPARLISAAISAWLTASHPNSEVKQVRAGVVLRWGTTREGPVLRFFVLFLVHIEVTRRFPASELGWDGNVGQERNEARER